MSARPNLKDFSLDALRERLALEGVAPYRAEQIAGWLYQRGIDDPLEMTDLSIDLRRQLSQGWDCRALEVERADRSSDGTQKAALCARDGQRIEAVLIPEPDRTTLCVSTQVGCPLACSFCATGAFGFRRNLSTAEIVDQVCRMRELLDPGRAISNVVFMGMGEPLLNLRAVLEAVRLLVHPKAFAMAPRRVTVSTVGIPGKIEELLDAVPVNLAVSLHATTNEVRDVLVPMNRRFPLEALLDTLRRIPRLGRRRPVFFEYTLIEGVNDSPADAERLPRLLSGIPSKLNLIPMNPHSDAEYRPPSEEVSDRFLRQLAAAGMTVTLRRSRGPDIDAACGQLALRRERESAGTGESGAAVKPPHQRTEEPERGHALRSR